MFSDEEEAKYDLAVLEYRACRLLDGAYRGFWNGVAEGISIFLSSDPTLMLLRVLEDTLLLIQGLRCVSGT